MGSGRGEMGIDDRRDMAEKPKYVFLSPKVGSDENGWN